MTNLLCSSVISDAVVSVIGIFVVFAVFVVVLVSAAKKRRLEESQQQAKVQRPQEFTDGNGRTQHQRDYINGLRVKLAEQKVAAQNNASATTGGSGYYEGDDHVHVGDKEERYEEIVGSLGDVNDEGCSDLDGVRLIVHDLAYEGEDAQRDYTEVVKVVVLGDIINNPRFKTYYRKK